MSCIVYGCPNNTFTEHASSSMPQAQFYSFPKHPVVVQQWIQATGWQPEHVDTSIAKICSIHFSEDSYTTEFKIIDYMTCYTKILKYDAVPTLYLPSTTAQIVIKETQVGADDGLQEMIVFALPAQEIATDPSKEYIELQVQQAPPEKIAKKYTQIKTGEQLLNLEKTNKELREKILKSEESIKALKSNLETQIAVYKRQDLELSILKRDYLRSKRQVLGLSEQKRLLSKVFSESQIKILSGKKKIYWSNDDMAVGYTIRHLSNRRCYLYLTKDLNIPLPAVSSIKRWMTLKSAPKKSLGMGAEAKKQTEQDCE